jgi:hypothetical protein
MAVTDQEKLEAIEARLNALHTPGPWRLWECLAGVYEVCKSHDYATGGVCQPHRKVDALFIAAAPTDIAFLLELARRNTPSEGPSKSKDPVSPDAGGGPNSSVTGTVLPVNPS